MTTQDRYIPGVPCWVDLIPPDLDAAADFYTGLFGWELVDVAPPEAPGHYLTARRDGGDIAAIGTPGPGVEPAPAWRTFIRVDDADATADRVRTAGGTVVSAPAMAGGDAGRIALLADPQGAHFGIFEPARHRGATVVNEPGAVNFNDLHTNDPEAAKAFYGAVFGWETIQLGDAYMWVLPAYGDFLEQRSPGLRARMQEMGAPHRFEEVVASMVLLTDEEAELAPRWGVTFGADDVDAVAARAVELGGEVHAGPFDAPWSRVAVLRDPQGTQFVASQFVPEPQGDAAAVADTAAA